jgi:hypothetical protein
MKATWDGNNAVHQAKAMNDLIYSVCRDVVCVTNLLQVYLKKIGLLRPYLTTWTSQVIRVQAR